MSAHRYEIDALHRDHVVLTPHAWMHHTPVWRTVLVRLLTYTVLIGLSAAFWGAVVVVLWTAVILLAVRALP